MNEKTKKRKKAEKRRDEGKKGRIKCNADA
jgi:hypothetical protein